MYRQEFALTVGVCIFAFIARPQVVSPASTPAWTMDRLVQSALTGNRDFLSAQQRIREAQGLLTRAGAGIPDSIEISGLSGQALGNAGEDSVSASWSHTFETFGKRARRVEIARRELDIAQAEIDERRRALIFEVKTRYAEAASEQLKLAVIERLLRVNQNYLRLTLARVEKGDVAQLEADLLRVELSRDESRRALTEGSAASALMRLRASVGIPFAESLSIAAVLSAPSIRDNLQSLIAAALRNRPDLRLSEAGLEQAKARVGLAMVETKPNLTLSGQYSHDDTAFEQFGLTSSGTLAPVREHVDSLGIAISIPLSTQRRNRGNQEAASARRAAAQLRTDHLRNAIPAEVQAAYNAWRAARQAVSIFDQDVVAQSEKNLEVMRKAYNLGELRLLDVLNEQRRLLDTELSYIETQADLFRAYAALEQAVGGSLQ